MKIPKKDLLLILICTILIAVGQILFKIGSSNIKDVISFFNIFIICGALTYLAGFINYIALLKNNELSFIAPLTALSFLWVGVLSILIINEKISFLGWTGISTIVLGVCLVGTGEKK